MSRGLSSGLETEVEADLVRPFFLVDLEFDSGTLYIWSGLGNLTWNNQTYLGVGDLLSVGTIEETAELGAVGASITLNGLKDDLIQKARDESYQGRAVSIRLGAFDSSASIAADPTIIFAGFMDVMTITEGETPSIQMAIENKLIQFDRSKKRRYTNEDQKTKYPTDKGFEFVTKVQDIPVSWGRTGGSGAGGGTGNPRPDSGEEGW
jgi:hypothetical protein